MSARAGTLVPENLTLLGHGAALLQRDAAVDRGCAGHSTAALSVPASELSREVHCLQGIPVDAVDMNEVVQRFETAAATRSPFLISTPNVKLISSELGVIRLMQVPVYLGGNV
jgi:hypothetical protein